MKTIIYQIEFFSDWHVGSGLSVAGDVDMAVLKDEKGMPYIPGKTLKGVLRHAAETLNQFQGNALNDFINEAFGLKTEPGSSHESQNQCFFSNAHLSTDLQSEVKDDAEYLYREIASTKIDGKTGVAQDSSLRKMEVAIPLALVAEIGNVREEWLEVFTRTMKMMKRMGGGRHRGLGRCKFSIIESKK